MELLDNPASPYCRKVRVLLHEAGMTDEVTLTQAEGHPTNPNKAAQSHNPLGKIPTLLRQDGPALYDSRVICRYLDAQAKAGLYPESRLWEVLTLEATADGIMDAAVLMVYETRSRAAGKEDEGWREGQWLKISNALDALEARWLSHLSGPRDMGQIAVGCALGYLDFRHGPREWRSGRPALAAWFETFGATEAMKATRPDAT